MTTGVKPVELVIEKPIVIADKSTNATCPECGEKVRFEGGCVVCPNCGYSKC
jgi:ribonucleoside-diphosphate reductase alpha chain